MYATVSRSVMQFFGYEPFLRRRCYLENGEHVKSRRTLLWCALSFVGILVLHCRCVWNRSCRFLCVFVLGSNAAVSPSARARARVEMTASLCTRVSFFLSVGRVRGFRRRSPSVSVCYLLRKRREQSLPHRTRIVVTLSVRRCKVSAQGRRRRR